MPIVKPNDITGSDVAQLIDENFDEIFEEATSEINRLDGLIGDGSSRVDVQDGPPPDPETGDLWFDSDNTQSSDGAVIVEAIDAYLGHTLWRTKPISSITQSDDNTTITIIYQDGTMTVLTIPPAGASVQTGAPASPVDGAFWWDTDDNT